MLNYYCINQLGFIIVDIPDIEVLLAKCFNKQRHAAVDASIHKGGPAVFDDQVARIVQQSGVLGIDGDDAIVERCRCDDQSAAVVSRPSSRE